MLPFGVHVMKHKRSKRQFVLFFSRFMRTGMITLHCYVMLRKIVHSKFPTLHLIVRTQKYKWKVYNGNIEMISFLCYKQQETSGLETTSKCVLNGRKVLLTQIIKLLWLCPGLCFIFQCWLPISVYCHQVFTCWPIVVYLYLITCMRNFNDLLIKS